VPTLHLQGANDGCIGPELAEGQARFFEGVFTSRVVPRVGHFLHLERPDLVDPMVLDWLAS
jgi:pimeloyl-ACP methyl ester carboxylesterase